MAWIDRFGVLTGNIGKLGGKRIAVLGSVGLTVFLLVAFASVFLSRPQFEVLYTGLDPQDIAAIGVVLNETDIGFDVSEDAKSIKVDFGQTSRARMLLAQKNLPRSSKAGYELFDNMGSLGLTSFMQEVTLVRSLEGEIARTVQLIQGVKAARVHIVMAKNSSFRRSSRTPTASIVIRTDSSYSENSAESIRHLVSAAVPSLSVDAVTVMNTNGSLLASGEDKQSLAPRRLVSLERTMSKEIKQNIRATLVPFLGLNNFQLSVIVRLNTDRRQVKETTYDPASRVERSVREIKEKGSAKNSISSKKASVDQEIPSVKSENGSGNKNSESKEKKEKLINYEISSKTVDTVGDGYIIKKISVAAVVNKKMLNTIDGKKLTPELEVKHQKDIQELIASAAGFDKNRNDNIKVTLVNFFQKNNEMAPILAPTFSSYFVRLIPNLMNGIIVLVVTGLVIFLGIRPATRALVEIGNKPQDKAGSLPDLSSQSDNNFALEPIEALPPLDGMSGGTVSPLDNASSASNNLIEDVVGNVSQVPMQRLEQLIEFDESKAAGVLKSWVHEEGSA